MKFTAESNGVSQLLTEKRIEIELGKNWLSESAIEELNPLRNSYLDLYNVVSVNEVKQRPF